MVNFSIVGEIYENSDSDQQCVIYLFKCFFIEGCTSGYNRQVAVYDCVLLHGNMGCSTILQQQQFIPVVQVGTIENAAVLQVGITA